MAKMVQVARFTADGTQVKREFDQMGAAGAQMSQRIERGAKALPPHLRAVDAAAGAAKQKVDGLANSLGTTGTVMRSLGPLGLAAAAGLGAITLAAGALHAPVRAAVRELAGIYDTAQQIGVTTDFLQEMRFAIAGTGQAASVADGALTSFARRLGQLNSEVGKTARGALIELGFSDEQIRSMRTVEQALPQIADRLAGVVDQQQRLGIAAKLGLEQMLPVLRDGEGALDRAAEAARRMGYVLDRDLLRRQSEMNGLWEQASQTIDLQFKATLVELAPVFKTLASVIAQGAVALRSFIDEWAEMERRSERTLHRNAAQIRDAQLGILARRPGLGIAEGGDVGRGERLLGLNGVNPAGGWGSFAERDARDVYAALEERARRIAARLNELGQPIGQNLPGLNPRDPDGDPARVSQHQAFVDQLRAELAAREAVQAVLAEQPKLSYAEAEALARVRQNLDNLSAARAEGVIASDAELERLRALIEGNHEAAVSERELADAIRAKTELYNRNEALRAQVETRQERIEREIADLRASGLDDDLVQRRIRQLSEEYHELAAAQYRASFEGRVLAEVLNGQIRNIDDLGNALKRMFADALIQELLNGGLRQPGGVGGLLGRVLDRIGFGGGAGGGGDAGGGIFGALGRAVGLGGFDLPGVTKDGRFDPRMHVDFEPLNQGILAAGRALHDDLTGGIASSVAEMVLGTTATATETAAKGGAIAATGVFAEKMLEAAAAASQFASAAGGGEDGGKSIVSSLFKSVLSGGRASGGPLFAGARHPFAEHGPELAVVGGWGHVVPKDSLDGLAALARMTRTASAAPRAIAAPIRIEIINQVSDAVAVEASQRTTAEGEQLIALTLTRKVASDIRGGALDAAARARWNARPPLIRR